jgi:hypothetical protein
MLRRSACANHGGALPAGHDRAGFEGKVTLGLYLHPTYTVTLGRMPLGVIDAYSYTRILLS